MFSEKVFRKLSYQLTKSLIEDIAFCKPGAIEQCLVQLQLKVVL